MKVFQTQNNLIIKENPGCFWLFGLFFAAFGVLFIYGSFNGFYLFGFQMPWAAQLTFLLGLFGIGIGILAIHQTPINNLEIDKISNQITLTRWGIFGKQVRVYCFDEIEKFLLIESKNSSGGTTWHFGMELTDGEQIPVTSLGKHPEDFENKFVYPINVFIGKELAACQLNFEPTDESAEEIS